MKHPLIESKISKTALPFSGTVIFAFLVGYYLFIFQVGVADSADFGRIMTRLGIGRPYDNAELNFFNFFNSSYPIVSGAKVPLDFSQFVAYISLQLNKLVYSTSRFSIFFLSGIYFIAYVVGFYLLLRNTSRYFYSKRSEIIFILLALLVFSDIMFVSYFNSFYQESLFLLSGLYVFAFSLKKKINYDFLLCALIVLSLSKMQNLLFILIPLILMRHKWQKLNKCLILSLLILIVPILAIQIKTQRQTNEANLYEAVFLGVLLKADRDEQIKVLKEIGLENPNYLKNVGRGYWRPKNEIYKFNLNEEFYEKINNFSVIKMYMLHPKLLWKTGMTGLELLTSSSAQPEHLGNLSLEDSNDAKKTIAKTVWGRILNYIFIPLYFFVLLYYLVLERSIKNLRENKILAILLLILPITYCAIFVTGGINDFIKHNFPVFFIISVLLLVFYLSSTRIYYLYSRKKRVLILQGSKHK